MFSPFYWLDVEKLERKLSAMSADGRHLNKMNFLLGTFSFTEGAPAEKTYLIRRAKKCGGAVPKKMAADGWQTVCGNKNNYAAVFDGKSDTLPSCRSYRFIVSICKMIFTLVVCYVVGFFAGSLAAYFDRTAVPAESEQYIGSFGEFIGIHAMSFSLHMAVLIIGAAALVTLIRSSHRYDSMAGVETELEFTIPKVNFIYTKEQEKQLRREKKLIVKTKPGWFYAPDKAEKYVEDMERQGWNFYRFDKMGSTFYFVKGQPRQIKFVVDYQNDISDEYLLTNIECGWKLQFKSVTKISGYVIWLKEYEGSEEPEFYSDGESMLKRARTLVITYGICFLPAIAAMLYVLINFWGSGDIDSSFMLFITVLYMAVLIELGTFLAMTAGFYLRMKKKYKDSRY